MVDFPTLSRGVCIAGYQETLAIDPTLRTVPEDGKMMTRGRVTSAKKRFTVPLSGINDTDKALLEEFEINTVNVGAETFNWTRHKQGVEVTFAVRLAEPITFQLNSDDPTLWDAMIVMDED